MRTADVGAPAFVTVPALTKEELVQVKKAARARASAEEIDDDLEHLRANCLQCCDEMDDVIKWAGTPFYFSPWFLIEGVDID